MLINGLEISAEARNGAQPKQSVGSPILVNLLAEAARFGFEKVLLLVSNQAEQVKDYLVASGVADRLGLQIDVMIKSHGVGTGGALWVARNHVDEWFYMLNKDCWFDFNWLSLVAIDGANQAVATIGLRRLNDARGYGVVETDGSIVHDLFDRSNLCGPGNVNCGVYLISRAIIEHLSAHCSLERDVFPILAKAGRLRADASLSRFRGIGMSTDFEMVPNLIPRRRRPAVFLDRDGTLNEDIGYVHRLEDFRWLPDAELAVRKFNDAGFYVFVVTNQAGVARGLYGERDVLVLHAWIQRRLRDLGAHIDDFRCCLTHPEGSIETYRRVDSWRKPGAGMLLDLIENWPIDLSRSAMIGDKDMDVKAGQAAGLLSVKIGPNGLIAEVDSLIERALAK